MMQMDWTEAFPEPYSFVSRLRSSFIRAHGEIHSQRMNVSSRLSRFNAWNFLLPVFLGIWGLNVCYSHNEETPELEKKVIDQKAHFPPLHRRLRIMSQFSPCTSGPWLSRMVHRCSQSLSVSFFSFLHRSIVCLSSMIALSIPALYSQNWVMLFSSFFVESSDILF